MGYEKILQELANGLKPDVQFDPSVRLAAERARRQGPHTVSALERGESVDYASILELQAAWRMALRAAGFAQAGRDRWWLALLAASVATAASAACLVLEPIGVATVAGMSFAFTLLGAFLAGRESVIGQARLTRIAEALDLLMLTNPRVPWTDVSAVNQHSSRGQDIQVQRPSRKRSSFGFVRPPFEEPVEAQAPS